MTLRYLFLLFHIALIFLPSGFAILHPHVFASWGLFVQPLHLAEFFLDPLEQYIFGEKGVVNFTQMLHDEAFFILRDATKRFSDAATGRPGKNIIRPVLIDSLTNPVSRAELAKDVIAVIESVASLPKPGSSLTTVAPVPAPTTVPSPPQIVQYFSNPPFDNTDNHMTNIFKFDNLPQFERRQRPDSSMDFVDVLSPIIHLNDLSRAVRVQNPHQDLTGYVNDNLSTLPSKFVFQQKPLSLNEKEAGEALTLFVNGVYVMYGKIPTVNDKQKNNQFIYSVLTGRHPYLPEVLANLALATLSFVNVTQRLNVPPGHVFRADKLGKMLSYAVSDSPKSYSKSLLEYIQVICTLFKYVANTAFERQKIRDVHAPGFSINRTSNSPSVYNDKLFTSSESITPVLSPFILDNMELQKPHQYNENDYADDPIHYDINSTVIEEALYYYNNTHTFIGTLNEALNIIQLYETKGANILDLFEPIILYIQPKLLPSLAFQVSKMSLGPPLSSYINTNGDDRSLSRTAPSQNVAKNLNRQLPSVPHYLRGKPEALSQSDLDTRKAKPTLNETATITSQFLNQHNSNTTANSVSFLSKDYLFKNKDELLASFIVPDFASVIPEFASSLEKELGLSGHIASQQVME